MRSSWPTKVELNVSEGRETPLSFRAKATHLVESLSTLFQCGTKIRDNGKIKISTQQQASNPSRIHDFWQSPWDSEQLVQVFRVLSGTLMSQGGLLPSSVTTTCVARPTTKLPRKEWAVMFSSSSFCTILLKGPLSVDTLFPKCFCSFFLCSPNRRERRVCSLDQNFHKLALDDYHIVIVLSSLCMNCLTVVQYEWDCGNTMIAVQLGWSSPASVASLQLGIRRLARLSMRINPFVNPKHA